MAIILLSIIMIIFGAIIAVHHKFNDHIQVLGGFLSIAATISLIFTCIFFIGSVNHAGLVNKKCGTSYTGSDFFYSSGLIDEFLKKECTNLNK